MKKISIIFILAILLVSPLAYSAGTAEGVTSTRNETNSSNESEGVVITTPKITSARVDCDVDNDLRDRIKCRLENRGNVIESNVPEACRGIEREAACITLYRTSALTCYTERDYRDRKVCFLRKSGIQFGGTLRSANNEQKQNYVVLLLYEVEERIEEMNEAGSLTDDESANLIEKIVEIKRMVLEGKTRQDIIPEIRELRSMYLEAIE